MMKRALAVPVVVVVALLAMAPPTATASVDWADPYPDIDFQLPASNGLRAHLEAFNDEVTLELEGGGDIVTYSAVREPREKGLKVRFGNLGLVDVAFEPTKTRTEGPPTQCEGKASTLSEGFFVGTIEFLGEREYVEIQSTRVEGTLDIWREGEWKCRHDKGPIRFRGASGTTPFHRGSETHAEKDPGSLIAANRRCVCYFAAYGERDRRGGGPSHFVGAKFEAREGMEISRVVYVRGGAATFVFDHRAGTASVRPPLPFVGQATFKRRAYGRDLLRGSIRVPLLGVDPFEARAPAFRAKLVHALPGR